MLFCILLEVGPKANWTKEKITILLPSIVVLISINLNQKEDDDDYFFFKFNSGLYCVEAYSKKINKIK